VNKYRFRLGQQQTKAIEVPISIAWDLNGVNDSIDLFESDVIRQVINPIDDFETTRYSHRPFRSGAIHSNQQETSTNYEFYFIVQPQILTSLVKQQIIIGLLITELTE
jgi:hypothetical protein